MSVGCQITDRYGLRTESRPPLCQLHFDEAAMVDQKSACTVWPSYAVHIKPKASETDGRAGYCKQTVQGP